MQLTPEVLMGIIMMVVIGPALGNYATSVVYRLPKGETPFEKNPYCGDCGTMLQPKDLFPLWSFIFSRGRCNYCGVRIRPMYFFIEVMGLIFCLSHFLLFGIGEAFLILTAICFFWLILAAIEWHNTYVATSAVVWTAALIAVWRVLGDVSLFPMIKSAVVMLVASMVFWKLFHKSRETLPDYCWALLLLGLATPMQFLPQALAVYLFCYWLLRIIFTTKHIHTAAAGLAWWLPAILL